MNTKERAIKEKYKFVISSIETFGLPISYDQWYEKGWIRIESQVWGDFRPLIIYSDMSESAILSELRSYMYSLGAYSFKLKLKNLFDL